MDTVKSPVGQYQRFMSSDTLLLEKRRKSASAEWWRPIWFATADVAELLPAGVASQWMTKYHGLVHSDDLLEADKERAVAVRTSLWQFYAALFIFTCSAASFLQRRKTVDGNQLYVFATFVCAGLVVGQLRGASTETLMLSYVSWAVCIAMLVSVARYHFQRPSLEVDQDIGRQ